MPQATKDNNKNAIKAAEKYVRQQIATMKEHGSAPKISADDFKDMVQKVAAASK